MTKPSYEERLIAKQSRSPQIADSASCDKSSEAATETRKKRVKRIVTVPPRKPGEAGRWLRKIGKPVDPKGWE